MTPASTQVTTLLTQFNLTTASEELVPRLTQAGHHDALPVLVEVFEAEAEVRRQRRIARLRRASRLPPGKTFETLDTGRLPSPLVQQLKTLATGAFLETVKLPQFRGHLSSWRGGGGVHDAENETAVPGGIPTADGRAGSIRT